MALSKISDVVKINKNMYHEDQENQKYARSSLSVWGKVNKIRNINSTSPRERTQQSKLLSSMIRNESLNLERDNQMKEIEDVKARMCRYKLPCAYKNIEKALLNPVETSIDGASFIFPPPGDRLIHNAALFQQKKVGPRYKRMWKKNPKDGPSKQSASSIPRYLQGSTDSLEKTKPGTSGPKYLQGLLTNGTKPTSAHPRGR